MTDETKKRGRGRPKGSTTKMRLPKTQQLLRDSVQGMEAGIKYFSDILKSEEVTPKQKEIAATRLMEIGYKFLTSINPEDKKLDEDQEPVTPVPEEEKKPAGFTLLNFNSQSK